MAKPETRDTVDIPNSMHFTPVNYLGGAWAGHMPFAYDLLVDQSPTLLVELGAHRGESYVAFCQSISENALATKSVAIDTWQGDPQAGFYSEQVFEEFKARNDRYFRPFSSIIRSTFDAALQKFEDNSIDLLHIDGLHTYEAVKHDFETWRPKLKNPAIVLFHDTEVRHGDFGVCRFWSELKQQYPTFEFVHSNGLGVLFWGDIANLQSHTGLVGTMLDSQLKNEVKTFYENFSTLFCKAYGAQLALDQQNRRIGKLERELKKSSRLLSFYPTRAVIKRLGKKLKGKKQPQKSTP